MIFTCLHAGLYTCMACLAVAYGPVQINVNKSFGDCSSSGDITDSGVNFSDHLAILLLMV